MKRRWLEPGFLGVILAAASSLWFFVALAGEVTEGETGRIDAAILLALHPSGDPDNPLGPPWLWEFARDVTALGSPGVLALLVIATCILLLLAGRHRTALFVLTATLMSWGMNTLLKLYFNRPRPTLIDHDMHLATSSFPSGHAMLSATVYLTLAAVVARTTNSRRLKLYILSVATALSGLVGVSRVYLGVHWPSDVLAGWSAGAAWALGAWGVAQFLHIGEDKAR